MADPRPQAAYLYTETRLNLDRAHAASTVLLELPTPSSLPHRAPPRRHVLLQDGIGRSRGGAADEASFARAHLAGDGGVFFRRADRYPRSLLWRLLDGRALLEVQSVDLAQDVGERDEASLTVQLRFPGAVRPHAVGFADPDESDALVVFAVTASGELYTVVLHRDMFVHLKASETPPPDWCAVFSPPALRIKEPFKLLVHSAHQLFLSLSDGGILMLDRKRGDDGMALLASDANADETGSLWRETYFTPPGWSLTIPRALAKWRGDSFVRFGDVELDPSTATSMAISPEEDTIITVCLNHTLRVWSLSTGKIVMQTDLLEDDGQNVQNQPKFLLGPNQRQLLAVSDVAGEDQDKYYIITFSPKLHKFSFWAVLDASSGLEGMRRVRPDFEFAPPIDDLMGTSAWIMEEFFVCPGSKWANTQLWLRARSGQVSRVFTVQFNLFGELDQIVAAWTHAWSAVSAGRQSSDSLSSEVPAVVRADDAIRYPGVSERWLAFLFYPGRFTLATLDTAFQVYSKRGSAKGSLASSSSGILKERMSAAVASRASSTDEVRLSEEWHVLYGLVHDLHKRRATTLSFAMDTIDRLPWIVAADFVSPVRVCTELDIYDFHRTAERSIAADEQIAARLSTSFESLDLLQAAHLFRSSLSPQAREQFSRIVFAFALEQPSASVVDRMMSLHEQADLSSVSDDDWNRVRDAMDEFGGLSVLDGANFTGVMELMDQSQAGRRNTDQITKYGARALNRVAQETTVLNLKVLLDLLLLVVFVEVEVDESELDADMENKWEGQDLFCSILGRLKETFVLDFLMKHWRTEQRKRLRSSSSSDNLVTSPSASQALQRSSYTSTLLESFFIGDWASMRVPENAEMPSLLTYWARQWTASFDLATNYDGFTAHVLAELIKMRDVALCTAFLPFAASTGWSTYLKARFHLMRADFDLAARGFKRAAFLLCKLAFAFYFAMLNVAQLYPTSTSRNLIAPASSALTSARASPPASSRTTLTSPTFSRTPSAPATWPPLRKLRSGISPPRPCPARPSRGSRATSSRASLPRRCRRASRTSPTPLSRGSPTRHCAARSCRPSSRLRCLRLRRARVTP
jgi:DNA repair protein RAD51/nuclear pore complex protein Nup160